MKKKTLDVTGQPAHRTSTRPMLENALTLEKTNPGLVAVCFAGQITSFPVMKSPFCAGEICVLGCNPRRKLS